MWYKSFRKHIFIPRKCDLNEKEIKMWFEVTCAVTYHLFKKNKIDMKKV